MAMAENGKVADPRDTERGRCLEILDRCVDFVEHESTLLQVAIDGLVKVEKMPLLLEHLNKYRDVKDGGKGQSDRKKKLEEAKKRADFVVKERKNGFPALHAHGVVSICAALDAMTINLCMERMRSRPHILMEKNFKNIKLPVACIHGMDDETRYELILEEVRNSTRSALRRGVDAYESLLEQFGLSGVVERGMRDDIHEMLQVRNVLLHRGGIADRRFVDACPQFGVVIGDPVRVSADTYYRYGAGALHYVIALVERVKRGAGVESSDKTGDVVGKTDRGGPPDSVGE